MSRRQIKGGVICKSTLYSNFCMRNNEILHGLKETLCCHKQGTIQMSHDVSRRAEEEAKPSY